MLSGASPTTISRLSHATTTALSLLRGRLHLQAAPHVHVWDTHGMLGPCQVSHVTAYITALGKPCTCFLPLIPFL